MGINSSRIAAGPTIQRRKVLTQPVTFQDGTTAPEHEGQVYFSYNISVVAGGVSRYSEMYVAVEIDSVLTWVQADLASYRDRYTGEDFNPMTFGPSSIGTS